MDTQLVYAFDFDGTLTSRDSLLAFIRYARGTWRFVAGMMLFSPLLILMKLHLYDNGKAKEKVFAHFFKGMRMCDFDMLCRAFADTHRDMIRPDALQFVRDKVEKDARVVIVSASIDKWVTPFTEMFMRDVSVIGTRVECRDGRLTGRFDTKNCYGEHKVLRLKTFLERWKNCRVIAFGDSRGDREMLAFADEGHYKFFTQK